MKNSLILIVIVAVLFAAGGFLAGMQYQKSQRSNFGQGGGQRGSVRFQGQLGNFRPVRGEIISADDKSITLKLSDGSSKLVVLSGNVAITESKEASKDTLKTGVEVMVFGSENSDGSVTAQNIQINPQSSGRPSSLNSSPI